MFEGRPSPLAGATATSAAAGPIRRRAMRLPPDLLVLAATVIYQVSGS